MKVPSQIDLTAVIDCLICAGRLFKRWMGSFTVFLILALSAIVIATTIASNSLSLCGLRNEIKAPHESDARTSATAATTTVHKPWQAGFRQKSFAAPEEFEGALTANAAVPGQGAPDFQASSAGVAPGARPPQSFPDEELNCDSLIEQMWPCPATVVDVGDAALPSLCSVQGAVSAIGQVVVQPIQEWT